MSAPGRSLSANTAAVRELVLATAWRQRWYCFVVPVGNGRDWEAHFNWQSYSTSVGLKIEGQQAFEWAVERVREKIADRRARMAAR